MFRLFRRKPSPYADSTASYARALRLSMTTEPESWRLECDGYYLQRGAVKVWTEHASVYQPRLKEPTNADLRCIREGIEAWIAWSLTRKETT